MTELNLEDLEYRLLGPEGGSIGGDEALLLIQELKALRKELWSVVAMRNQALNERDLLREGIRTALTLVEDTDLGIIEHLESLLEQTQESP